MVMVVRVNVVSVQTSTECRALCSTQLWLPCSGRAVRCKWQPGSDAHWLPWLLSSPPPFQINVAGGEAAPSVQTDSFDVGVPHQLGAPTIAQNSVNGVSWYTPR